MGYGIFSGNTTIKANAAVSATGTSGATLYTAPSTGYAIINVCLSVNNSTNVLNITVGTRIVLQFQTGATVAAPGVTYYPIMVGPSQVVGLSGGGGGTVVISGTEFVNSP